MTSLYVSSTADGAWGELFRQSSEISRSEIKRRLTELDIRDLPVLDLTDPANQEDLGIPLYELVGRRRTATQAIGDLVRSASHRFGGILAPSAVNPRSLKTLVIFRERLGNHVSVARHAIRRAPRRR